jgi:N4-(beta-N-acetylglucosaminyl)-L-asparaginase
LQAVLLSHLLQRMSNRRSFLKKSVQAAGAISLLPVAGFAGIHPTPKSKVYKKGLVISTWNHGIPANKEAWRIINAGGKAIDAAELGVRIVESDPTGQSVGLGGMPDRDGHVTLDACIMDHNGNAGAVCFLQNIMHPISVARQVMDQTPHVMLAGEGARQFAIKQGFKEENLLTPESEAAWKKWLKESKYDPIINIENHDTIGLITMDKAGNLSGACTTSGLGFKMHGRVGDSPIIGAGLFVDNEIGAATATGLGEAVMKTLGSFLIVELMRQGASPQQACEEAVRRIAANQDADNMQIGYLAVNKAGEVGAYAIHPGFNYALHKNNQNVMIDAHSMR